MKQELLSFIEQVKGNRELKNFSEDMMKQGVILPLLQKLGWNPFNTREVYPEFPIEKGRVDYSIRFEGKSKAFIEAKRPDQDLDRHVEQLLQYSFRDSVPMAIITNGITWWFYLPLEVHIPWEQRKFISINFHEQSAEMITRAFVTYLSKENVISGDYEKSARDVIKNEQTNKIIRKTMPEVWRKVVSEPNSRLVDIIADETEAKCGHRPDYRMTVNFVWKIAGVSLEDRGTIKTPPSNPDLEADDKKDGKLDSESFLQSLDANGRAVFEKILDMEKKENYYTNWGSAGFSMNYRLKNTHFNLFRGYRPDSVFGQSVRCMKYFYKLENADRVFESFMNDLKKLGCFEMAEKSAKWVIDRRYTDKEVQGFIDAVKRLVEMAKEGEAQKGSHAGDAFPIDLVRNKNTKPVRFSFKGRDFNVNSWRELYHLLLEEIHHDNQSDFDRILEIKGTKSLYFSYKKELLKDPKEIDDSGIYTDLRVGRRMFGIIPSVLDMFGYKPSDVMVEVKDEKVMREDQQDSLLPAKPIHKIKNTHTKPVRFTFKGKSYNGGHWKEFFLSLLELILNENRSSFERILEVRGKTRKFFSLSKNDLKEARRIDSADIFAETSLSGKNFCRVIIMVLEKFGYSLSDVLVEVRDTSKTHDSPESMMNNAKPLNSVKTYKTRPTVFSFEGKAFKVRGWKELLKRLLESISNEKPGDFDRILEIDTGKRAFFSYDRATLKKPEEIADTGIFVEGYPHYYMVSLVIDICKNVLNKFSYSPGDLLIHVKDMG